MTAGAAIVVVVTPGGVAPTARVVVGLPAVDGDALSLLHPTNHNAPTEQTMTEIRFRTMP